MTERDTSLRLPDGRRLAYTEHGDPAGRAVFFCHGNPGSRLQRHPDEGIAERLGVRLITPDRPGYGRSDFQPGRTLRGFAGDLGVLADALDIDSFAIFGVSAGGPYVAACAHEMPERVRAAAIVSGVAPVDRRGALDGVHGPWRMAFGMGRWMPQSLLYWAMWSHSQVVRHHPGLALDHLGATLSRADRELLARPALRRRIEAYGLEAVRGGIDGLVQEAKLLTRPWGFRLEAISVPIDLWYWQDDPSTPPQMGRYLASRLPRVRARFFPGGGHLSLFEHWESILASLAADPVGASKSKRTVEG